MKIVLDIQGLQTASKFRGIGRHTLELTRAILRNRKQHDVVLVGNAIFKDYDALLAAFRDLISRNDLRLFDSESPISYDAAENDARRGAAEAVRACHIANLLPDVVHVFSPVESVGEQCACGIVDGVHKILHSATLHDLIPLIFGEQILHDPVHAACYYQKIRNLMRMDVLLAISEASRRDAVSLLAYPEKRIFSISSAAGEGYGQGIPANADLKKIGISKPYVLTVGIFEFRKNIDRLLQAFALLPPEIRDGRQLVLACQGKTGDIRTYRAISAKLGLKPDSLVITSYLSEAMLQALYACCELFVFPSLYEGFGLPALEAMLCGAPVLAADTSSLPEVMGMEEALFDPYDVRALSAKIHAVLTDQGFKKRLLHNSAQQPLLFSWDKSAQLAIEAWEKTIQERDAIEIASTFPPKRPRLAYVIFPLPWRNTLGAWTEHVIFCLEAYYEVTLVCPGASLESAWLRSLSGLRSPQWLQENANSFDRVVYHVEHLVWYEQLKDCMAEAPGALLLGSGLIDAKDKGHEDLLQNSDFGLPIDQLLYESLGYSAFLPEMGVEASGLLYDPAKLIGWSIRNALGISSASRELRQEILSQYHLPAERVAVLAAPLHPEDSRCKIYDMHTSVNDYLGAFREWLEACYARPYITPQEVVKRIAASVYACEGPVDKPRQGEIVDTLFGDKSLSRQLLVDISELEQRDARTGIQRVTRALLAELLQNPPKGYRVEPVCASLQSRGYRYARTFTLRFLGVKGSWAQDAPVTYGKEDIFLGLDLQAHTVVAQHDWLYRMRSLGVQTYFVVHDLLPVQFPQFFSEGTEDNHEKWLRAIHDFDGALCVSRSVARQLARWYEVNDYRENKQFRISHFHHGADIESSVPTLGGLNRNILKRISSRPTFLMVGTLEQRKNHVQMLEAMEILWQENSDALFVIVGRKGWLIDEFANRLKGHPEANNRLLWLQDVSDEYLQAIYKAVSAVVMTSFGEGFGLPIIEAARYGTPLILRDLPVFQEIAGKHAWYFTGFAPGQLAVSLKQWLAARRNGTIPDAKKIRFLTWKESCEMMCNALFTMVNSNNG